MNSEDLEHRLNLEKMQKLTTNFTFGRIIKYNVWYDRANIAKSYNYANSILISKMIEHLILNGKKNND